MLCPGGPRYKTSGVGTLRFLGEAEGDALQGVETMRRGLGASAEPGFSTTQEGGSETLVSIHVRAPGQGVSGGNCLQVETFCGAEVGAGGKKSFRGRVEWIVSGASCLGTQKISTEVPGRGKRSFQGGLSPGGPGPVLGSVAEKRRFRGRRGRGWLRLATGPDFGRVAGERRVHILENTGKVAWGVRLKRLGVPFGRQLGCGFCDTAALPLRSNRE